MLFHYPQFLMNQECAAAGSPAFTHPAVFLHASVISANYVTSIVH